MMVSARMRVPWRLALSSFRSRRWATKLASPWKFRTSDGIVTDTVCDSRQDKPLLVVLGWSNSTIRVLSKYAALYCKFIEDCDAVLLPSTPRLVYRPSTATAVMADLGQALLVPELANRRILIVGFSVGAYLYGHLVRCMRSDAALEDAIAPRLEAIVFDSPVDFQGVPAGLSKSILDTRDSLAQRALQRLIEAYLSVFSTVAAEYLDVSTTVHNHPYEVPSLWLYSDVDFAAASADVKRVIDKWNRRFPTQRCDEHMFHGSAHVSHFPNHPARYEAVLYNFLQCRTELQLLPRHVDDTSRVSIRS